MRGENRSPKTRLSKDGFCPFLSLSIMEIIIIYAISKRQVKIDDEDEKWQKCHFMEACISSHTFLSFKKIHFQNWTYFCISEINKKYKAIIIYLYKLSVRWLSKIVWTMMVQPSSDKSISVLHIQPEFYFLRASII